MRMFEDRPVAPGSGTRLVLVVGYLTIRLSNCSLQQLGTECQMARGAAETMVAF
jgi:hypothetical protein